MSLVAIDRFSYRYPGSEMLALDEISLDVQPGEFIVLAGNSGSGKSTLLRAISGLVPNFHGGEASGEVSVDGLNTRSHGPGDLARAVGSLFQDPETQIILGTARNELAFGLQNRGVNPAAVARAVEETALALAIEPLLDRSTAELSGGELQRVALGATLAGAPSVVCLDEPTSQLDPVAGDELIGLLQRLNHDRDLAVILAEHRLERCLPFADRVVAMDAGHIVFDGLPGEFLAWALEAAPALVTPGARMLAQVGMAPVAGVRGARGALRTAGIEPCGSSDFTTDPEPHGEQSPRRWALGRRSTRSRGTGEPTVLRVERAWHEPRGGGAILRGISMQIAAGERVALMGRNGAGKSTLLRHVAGLMKPTRGAVHAPEKVPLVLQNPNDYLIHETVSEEASATSLARFGLAHLADRHPRDLSGGERQRLALAIVLDAPGFTGPPALVCMDEPTRGMDRSAKGDLARTLAGLGCAVLVATHDPEFAAAFADRVVLMAEGDVIADGGVGEILSGGTYFATETARILGGSDGVLLPEDGARLLMELRPEPVEGATG